MKKTATLWLLIGLFSAVLLPWYAVESDFLTFQWLFFDFGSSDSASALIQSFAHGRWWLFSGVLPFLVGGGVLATVNEHRKLARLLVLIAVIGIVMVVAQGFIVARTGPAMFVEALSQGAAATGQVGMGVGAMLVLAALLFMLTTGISGMGKGRGDAFIVGLIGLIIALVATFVFFPVSHILIKAFQTSDGSFALGGFFARYFSSAIWGVRCIIDVVGDDPTTREYIFFGKAACGPAMNSLALAIMTGAGTTALGLAFALIATRTGFKFKKLLRILTVMPIITPPFVIGLALILLFGRTGTVTGYMYEWFEIPKSRWLYGFSGVYLAQMLSFTPIAFLVLIGVVEGVSPSMEEASQTLHADRWQTFKNVSFPLMRPGLANAFLLGFIESIADFGNPLVLGGNYNFLSTEIYFAIIGSVADPGKAATLAIVLLTLTLSAFVIQRKWLGNKSYATVTGKADSGQHSALNPVLKWIVYGTAIPWAIFTAIVYSMIFFGSFVKLWRHDSIARIWRGEDSFTIVHYVRTFGIKINDAGNILFKGVAWDSYFTTLTISTIAAPLTAVVGLATAYLLVRQKFAGKDAFEFSTMLSFAIPGTVIGVSYIMAFNVPPIEITGTSIILIIVFVFRNMPVGVRGGIAALSQLDKSLDEASSTLGANSFTTVRKVIIPLMGPAMLAVLTYSFVRAITSVSAVIFLVSAKHNMATSFIVGRVENQDFGIAIAYATVLIFTMLAVILLMQLLIGKRKLRREDRVAAS